MIIVMPTFGGITEGNFIHLRERERGLHVNITKYSNSKNTHYTPIQQQSSH
jgi:hypothetical protein